MKKYRAGLSFCALVLSLTLTLAALMPARTAAAEKNDKPETVRVGFFALDGYHEMDEDGNRSGYGYDFFHLTEKYANINYEYVGYDKTWEETLQMLSDGEIDIATGANKTKERTKLYDFSMPIGTSSINLNTRASETRFVADDYATYNGMTVGLLAASSENDLFEDFAKENGFSYTAKYYPDAASLKNALEARVVDAVATSSLRKIENEKILSSFYTQNFYAIVKKGNTALLDKINYAITQLNASEGDWQNDFYYDNYTADNYDDLTFTAEEQSFIDRYSTGGEKLVIALDNDWRPFSWKDGDGFSGILPEYIESCMELCGMNYTYYDFDGDVFDPSPENMRKVDFYACYGLPDTDDNDGLLATTPMLENGSAYLQRRNGGAIRTVALARTTPNLNTRITGDEGLTFIEYADTTAAKQAVLDNEADAAFLYGYDAEYSVNQDKTGTLAFTMLADEAIEIRCVASADNDHTLISILTKCINCVPSTEKNSIISKYISYSVTQMTLTDYIAMHPILAGCVGILFVAILLIIAFILMRNRAEVRHRSELEEKVVEINALNEEQEAQLEEIRTLNEEQDAQLEEIRGLNEEQEAQLEEIRALNEELEDQQARLEEACEEAESANNAKTSFLFNMSHDIRTPMNAIIGFPNLLEKYQDDAEKRADYLKKIQDSSSVLLSIINNVLEMARIEKGTLTPDESAWSTQEFYDSLCAVFEDMMQQKEITFTQEFEVEHAYVYFDSIKLREVLLNILSNAYKYTNSGGCVHMKLKELPSDREGCAIYRTSISDTGMGMAEDFLPHIFEEFSRENNTTDNKIEGTGLGMPIVKRLVEFMGGTIEVRSQKNVGSTFIVTIPHRIADHSDQTTQTVTDLDVNRFEGKRILLAEDNELNAEIALEILEEAGFVVDHAADGQICVDMLQKAGNDYYDLILMDIQMPNLNGYEATKAIRSLSNRAKASIPIIAMTANAFEEDKRNAQQAGMNGHLAKPINVQELYKTLTGILTPGAA